MKRNKKKTIGSFGIKSDEMPTATVVISQETSSASKVIKHFNLNSADGEAVYRTEDPNTFILENGTRLKKITLVELW
jgi:hypothetical protein